MKERVDAKINQEKIAKEVLINPLQSQQKIADKTWLGKTTVHEHLKNLPNTNKDERIRLLTDDDFECIRLWVVELKKRLSTPAELEKMRAVEISQVIKENTARYSLFRWDATDREWGAKTIESIDIL